MPDRYLRQTRFAPLGEQGQQRLMQGRALVCGCGALGCAAANTLVRGGVGTVRIVDRDVVELGNLHRQVLFDEEDARRDCPRRLPPPPSCARPTRPSPSSRLWSTWIMPISSGYARALT